MRLLEYVNAANLDLMPSINSRAPHLGKPVLITSLQDELRQ
jgi:hypothetical protein